MKKCYLSLLAFLFFFNTAIAQGDCSSAIIICGNTQPFNPSGIGNKLEQLACGGIEHNSIWLAFQAKANGKLNFAVRAFTLAGLPTTADFDWSLFALTGPPGAGTCDQKTQISCNFAGTATVFGIPGTTGMATPNYTSTAFNPGVDVVSGNWYALIVDQFSNTTPLLFSVQFTGSPETPYINSTPAIFDNRPDFSITNTSGCGGAYSFTNSSVAAAGIASYSWNFGDGTTSTSANPTHTYATSGTYYVTLTVTDNNGCASDIRKTIVYNNTPPTVNAAGLFVLPACSDANNGSLTVTTIGATTPGVTGGTPPYTFELVSPSAMIRPSQSSNTFTGLQSGGYTIKVTDACGKSATGTATITQIATNSTIGLGIQNVQSSCGNTPTGIATIFANGTNAPITMSLVASSPVLQGPLPAIQRDPVTATYFTAFTSLLPGVYTVEATDACGKIRRATFTVTQSTAPTVGAVNSASCGNTPTGTINVTATAGTGITSSGSPGTFQYALLSPSPVNRPFQTSSLFENLFPGIYTVAVMDQCGNVGTATTTIATAPAPTFGTAFTTISCPNGATGTFEAQVSAVGGGTPFTFELVPPSPIIRPPQANNTFTNLTPGVYTVRLTDACGTIASQNVTINSATAPTFTPTIGSSCTTPASGTITVAPAATTLGPFTFELISPGAAIRPPQGSNIANTTSSIFTGLDQGSYTIRMTDGCGVPVTGTATVTAPTALAFPAGSTSAPSCSGSSIGRIVVAQPTTGLAAYRYELIAPSPLTVAPQYSRIFDNLPAGDYTIRITDSCGTQITIGAPLTVAVATAPTLSVTNTSSCAVASGTITTLATTANQGGGTYLYALIAPSPVTTPNQSSPIFTGLPAGAYTVLITDQCGQTGTALTTIAAAGAFSPAAGGSVVGCTGAAYNAQIIVTTPQNFTPGGPIPPGSGGGPYTYALYDATNTTLLAGPQASNIFTTVVPAAGNPSHTVRVTDICGNTSTGTLAVNPPAALTNPTISAITASCPSSATGVIRVTTAATGGLAPYFYTLLDATATTVIAGPQTGIVFEGMAASAGGYTIRVTDACGNTATNATPLVYNAAVTPTVTGAATASCASSSTGRIVATPGTGATLAGGTFSYALYDAGNTVLIAGPQASPTFTGVAAAAYTLRIIDQCGQTGTASVTVTSTVTALTAAGTGSGPCTASSNGVITGSFTGGSLPITYTLLDQLTMTVVAGPQASNIFTGLAAGTYIVQTADACGTTANSTNIVLTTLSTAPTLTTTQALDCSGLAIVSGYGASGSGGPFTYAICSGAGCTGFGAFAGSSTFNVTISGTYRIAVRDRCNLETPSGDIVVSIPVKPVMTGVVNTVVCGPTTITPSYTGIPNTPYFSVDGSNFSPTTGTINPECHTFRVADFNAGTYGCASDPFEFSVVAPPTLRSPASIANGWQVNCAAGTVIPAIAPGTGETGCVGSGITFGVQLAACNGCDGSADAIGTLRAEGVAFNVGGASTADFEPVLINGGTDICANTTVVADFLNASTFNCSFALPLEIEYFNGRYRGTDHELNWKIDCDNRTGTRITLERSVSTTGNFTSIYEVVTDLTRCSQPFMYLDMRPATGMNYYRIKLTGIDNEVKYSRIIALSSDRGSIIVNILLNPVRTSGEAILNVTSGETGKMRIVVTDMAGKQLHTQNVSVVAGSNQVTLNMMKLAVGVYQLTATFSNGATRTVRFMKE
jgi:PKD repeat protein